MATRSQVDRIVRRIAAIEAASAGILYVPVLFGETEAEALALYRKAYSIDPADLRLIAYNHVRIESREEAEASGTDIIYGLGPDTVVEILGQIDGRTRGIPITL